MRLVDLSKPHHRDPMSSLNSHSMLAGHRLDQRKCPGPRRQWEPKARRRLCERRRTADWSRSTQCSLRASPGGSASSSASILRSQNQAQMIEMEMRRPDGGNVRMTWPPRTTDFALGDDAGPGCGFGTREREVGGRRTCSIAPGDYPPSGRRVSSARAAE